MVDVYFFWTAWVVWIALMVPQWKLDKIRFNQLLPDGSWVRAIYFGTFIFVIIVMGLTFYPAFNLGAE